MLKAALVTTALSCVIADVAALNSARGGIASLNDEEFTPHRVLLGRKNRKPRVTSTSVSSSTSASSSGGFDAGAGASGYAEAGTTNDQGTFEEPKVYTHTYTSPSGPKVSKKIKSSSGGKTKVVSSSAACSASSSSATSSGSYDAYAIALADSIAEALCTPYSEAWGGAVASAVVVAESKAAAVAQAIAIAKVSGGCNISGNAFGCASAQSYAEAFASAEVSGVAAAFASAAAGAINGYCPCATIDIATVPEVWAEAFDWRGIVVQAVANAFDSNCSDKSFVISDVEKCIVKGILYITAKAVSSAYAAAGCGFATASASVDAEIVTELETHIGKGCRYGNDGIYEYTY